MDTPTPPATPRAAPAGTRPRRRLFAKFAAAAIGLALALVLAEIALRVAAPQRLSGTWRVVTPRGYPVNRAGGEARHDGPGGTVRYRFNELRLRGGPVAPAGLRVLCLGDSFTFGWGLPEDETYVGRIQAKADERFGAGTFQVLNGGCGGWGTDDCVAFAEDFGPAIRPDAVLVFLNSWDVGRSLWGGPFVLNDAVPPGVEPRGTPVPVSRTTRFLSGSAAYQWLLEHSHAAQFVRNVAVRIRSARDMDAVHEESAERLRAAPAAGAEDSANARDAAAIAMGEGLFRRLAAWCDAHRAALWVVTTGRQETPPERATASGDLEATLAFKRTAPALFEELRVPYFEIAPDVARACGGSFGGLVFVGEGHPTGKGAALIADAAFARLLPLLDGLARAK